MPWVKFTKTFPWSPVKAQTVIYKAGMEMLVTTPCAAAALKASAAEKINKPVPVAPAPVAESAPVTPAPAVRRSSRKSDGGNEGQKSGQA